MTAYVLWVLVFLLVVLAGAVSAWVFKRPGEEDEENEEDLTEWTCPTCGFHVQVGTECIYCGEQKPV